MASVLVVNELDADRAWIATLLFYAGHSVDEAASGEEAIAAATNDPPDLIISELLMSGMSGYEFARRLHEDPSVAEIPLIVLTASYVKPEIHALIESLGISSFVERPIDPEQIMRAVAEALGAEHVFDPLSPDRIGPEQLRILNETLASKTREVEEAAVERRELVAHLLDAHEEERARLSRDIHDDPLQAVLAAALQLETLERHLAGTEDVEAIGVARQSVVGAAERLRSLLFQVLPPELEAEGLAAVLRSHQEQWEGDVSFEVETDIQREMPRGVRIVLYRAAEEALVNARKHARARRISVLISERDRGFLVRMSDDGVGFKPAEQLVSGRDHFGLRALRERLELAGGSLRIESAPGEGTSLEMWVPAL